jgi:CYTH domain-containing protein
VSDQAVGWLRRPGEGAYARVESERRFLVARLPEGLVDERLIEDLYLDGVRLRLRKVSDGTAATYKLTQKVRPDPADPATVRITNVYLTRDEYNRLATLPGAQLSKTRGRWVTDAGDLAVDRFHGPLTGLLLAEVEVDDVRNDVALPAWVGPEVTHDDRFCGGSLARTDATGPCLRALAGEGRDS